MDGIGAYDFISRWAMLLGLESVEGGSAVFPFVHLFYSTPSAYLWEDDERPHCLAQRESGEQGDALMPLLFCVGQHSALQPVQHSLRPNERLLAFLDDLYVVSKPDRVGAIYRIVQESLWAHAGIRVHGGKTHVWNSACVKPDVCDALQRIAQASDPCAWVWRDSELPPTMQGMKVLGTPLGHLEYVAMSLEGMRWKHSGLLEAHTVCAQYSMCMAPPTALRIGQSELLVACGPS